MKKKERWRAGKTKTLRQCSSVREVWTESWAEGESRIHWNNNGLGTEWEDYQKYH